MNDEQITQTLAKITSSDPRFSREAYELVGHVVKITISKMVESGEERHVTGLELLENIREFALEQFGPMTTEVFKHWGISDTMDIGQVVFNMVDNQLLSSSESDSIDDFDNVFDFHSAFIEPFLPVDHNISDIEAID